MVDRQKSHFGSDGYRDLAGKEMAEKRHRKLSPEEKELFRLRDLDNKRKTREPRASKYIMPQGVGGKRK